MSKNRIKHLTCEDLDMFIQQIAYREAGLDYHTFISLEEEFYLEEHLETCKTCQKSYADHYASVVRCVLKPNPIMETVDQVINWLQEQAQKTLESGVEPVNVFAYTYDQGLATRRHFTRTKSNYSEPITFHRSVGGRIRVSWDEKLCDAKYLDQNKYNLYIFVKEPDESFYVLYPNSDYEAIYSEGMYYIEIDAADSTVIPGDYEIYIIPTGQEYFEKQDFGDDNPEAHKSHVKKILATIDTKNSDLSIRLFKYKVS